MKKTVRVIFVLFLSVIFSVPVMAQRTYTLKKTLPEAVVISPIEGQFSNYQALVLSVPEDCNVFYSFTGTDPLLSGFAYDSPVIIERLGDITLRIATVSQNNESTEQVIRYSVDLAPVEQKFYTESLTNPLVLLNSANPLFIPENMLYSVGDYDVPFISGRSLKPEKNNGLSRIMSLLIKDEDRLYRIMVNMTEEYVPEPKVQSPKNSENTEIVPFVYTCKNWTDLSIEVAEGTVLAIDGQEYKKNVFDVSLDRTRPHIFAWTDKETKETGSLVLPPKPEIIKLSETASISSPIDLFISDPRFTFTSALQENAPFYTKCRIDTIYGDDLAGTLEFKVFYDGIYQGNLSVTLALDKKPPKKPVFTSDALNQKYERKPVKLSLQSDGQIYYRISSPIKSDFGFNDNYEKDFAVLKADDNPEPFEKYLNVPVLLKGSRDGATYYYVEAYAQDYAGNKSETAAYATVIDPYNFYVTARDNSEVDTIKDGSPSHPFTDLNQVLELVNETGCFVRIHLNGVFENCKSLLVKTECDIIASEGSCLEFAEGETIIVDKAKLSISNLVIESIAAKLEELTPKNAELSKMVQKNLITVNRGSLSLDKCEVVGVLGINGSLVNLQNSILEIKDCGLTAHAKNYTTIISGVNVDAKISNTRLTSIGDTAVALSMNRGSLDLLNNEINIYSNMGRACEFTRLDYKITSNVFNTAAKNPVWADKRCTALGFENNTFNIIDVSVQKEVYENASELVPLKTDTDKNTVNIPEKAETKNEAALDSVEVKYTVNSIDSSGTDTSATETLVLENETAESETDVTDENIGAVETEEAETEAAMQPEETQAVESENAETEVIESENETFTDNSQTESDDESDTEESYLFTEDELSDLLKDFLLDVNAK